MPSRFASVTNKVWFASFSACVVYTKTIIHLSVGESGEYLPPLHMQLLCTLQRLLFFELKRKILSPIPTQNLHDRKSISDN